MHYVLAVCYRLHKEEILLVLKDRPASQAGRFNCVGGKIEEGETPLEAVIREVKEESGYNFAAEPKLIGQMLDNKSQIFCFYGQVKGPLVPQPREGETEKVEWFNWYQIKEDPRVIPNLKVIVPLA